MRAMVEEVNAFAGQVEALLERLRGSSGGDARVLRGIQAVADKLLTNPIRYSQPGLRTHISYLAGMASRVDQKVGRDAFERYEVLRAELDELKAEVARLAGSISS